MASHQRVGRAWAARDVISARLVLLQQQGLTVPSPRGTADPFSNIPPQYRGFYKAKETHLALCVSCSSVATSWLKFSATERSFTRERWCGHRRASLPAPPPGLGQQLSLTNEATSLLIFFLYLHSQPQWDTLWNAESGVAAIQFRGINPPFLFLLCLQALKSGLGKPCFSVLTFSGESECCAMMGGRIWVLQCMFSPLGIWQHPLCWT